MDKTVSTISSVFAILFAVIYLFSAWKLYETFAVSNVASGNWDHAWSIFSGIQSAGISAIGVLLGVAVQQPRVSEAKAQTARAKSAIQSVLSTNEKGGGVSPQGDVRLTEDMRRVLQEGLAA